MFGELLPTLDYTLQSSERSVADLSDQQMVEQPNTVPNHRTWTLGHVILRCQGIATEMGAPSPIQPSPYSVSELMSG